MEALHISEIIEGMVLGMAVTAQDFLIEKGTILNQAHIQSIRDYGIETLWIDTEANLEEILRKRIHSLKLNRKVYASGEFVCLQGDPSTEFYILLEGELEVILVDEQRLSQCSSRKSREEVIQGYGNSIATLRGRLVNFGEMGPLLGQTRTATIRAKNRSVVQSIPASGEGFSRTFLENPELGFSVAITVAKRLYDTISGIEKYDRILMQLYAITGTVKSRYAAIVETLQQKHEITGEQVLKNICNKFWQKSILVEKSGNGYGFLPISPGLRTTVSLNENDDVFAGLTLMECLAGTELPMQDENNDYIYLVCDGELLLDFQGQFVKSFSHCGDIIGSVKALSFIDLNYRRIGDEQFVLRAGKDSRVYAIPCASLKSDPATYKHLILHICRVMAEHLKNHHHLQTESLARIEAQFNRYSYGSDSYLNELRDVLSHFFDNQQWISLCLNEVLTLKETLDQMESDFIHLKDCVKASFVNPFAMPLLKLGNP